MMQMCNELVIGKINGACYRKNAKCDESWKEGEGE